MVAQVQVDDLRLARQWSEVGLEAGVVVTAAPTVEEHDRRPLAHHRTVRHQSGAVDVEPQAGPVHVHLHELSTPRVTANSY